MADQRSRGGKKVGAQEPNNPDKQQKGRDQSQRPNAGQPGGPKPHTGQTRPEHHK